MVLLGTAEVAVTGSLVSKLGITNLVVLYVITTILGGTLLLLQHSRMTKLYKLLGDSASENMSEELKAENKSPEVIKFQSYIFIGILYSFAWVLILVPGLVTDLAGFIEAKSGSDPSFS